MTGTSWLPFARKAMIFLRYSAGRSPKKFNLMKSREDGGYDQEVMVISSSRAALGGFNDL
jgi:hypothetical protein